MLLTVHQIEVNKSVEDGGFLEKMTSKVLAQVLFRLLSMYPLTLLDQHAVDLIEGFGVSLAQF
jgi:hypothetical protein